MSVDISMSYKIQLFHLWYNLEWVRLLIIFFYLTLKHDNQVLINHRKKKLYV